MITIKDLVLKNLRALDDGSLQALIHPGRCWYSHPEDGSRCAVGQVLSDDVLDRVLNRGDNGMGVGYLLDQFVIQVENRPVFETTQALHDSWGSHRPIPADGLPDPLVEAFEKIGTVNASSFRGWLMAVANHFNIEVAS